MAIRSDRQPVIRAVAFDLDDTLWDLGPVIARAERAWFDWLREHCPRIVERLSLEELRAGRLALATREPHNAHDFTYLRIRALAQHALECGYGEEVAEHAFEVFFAARNRLDPYIDVRPGLERLGRRHVLASLSNGNADLARIGLGGLFAVCLNARGIGAAKPDPRCFEALLAALRLEAAEVLYVGDDPVLDVDAARRCGLRTAWMHRAAGAQWPEDLPRADLEVADCLQLATRLGAFY